MVRSAAASVNRVQQLAMPNYNDELVALFYAGRFHLSHVNLAYSMISGMVTNRDPLNLLLTDSGRLHVIDFGCGTMAMRFGVIFAVADALERGQTIEEVRIDSIDPNTSMVNMGVKVWDEFLTQLRHRDGNNDRLQWIENAIERLNNPSPVVRNTTLNHIEGNAGSDVWLSAIHIVYGGNDGNEVSVGEDLARITVATHPTVGFITCHGKNTDIARRISPFGNNYVGRTEIPGVQFSNLIPTPLISQRCIAWGFFPSSWRVFWQWGNNPENTTCLTYQRRD